MHIQEEYQLAKKAASGWLETAIAQMAEQAPVYKMAIGRYRMGFAETGSAAFGRPLIIGNLNSWFIDSNIRLDGCNISIFNKDEWFDTDGYSVIPELHAALTRAMNKCGIIGKQNLDAISINPESKSINYKIGDAEDAERLAKFLHVLQLSLTQEHKARKVAAAEPVIQKTVKPMNHTHIKRSDVVNFARSLNREEIDVLYSLAAATKRYNPITAHYSVSLVNNRAALQPLADKLNIKFAELGITPHADNGFLLKDKTLTMTQTSSKDANLAHNFIVEARSAANFCLLSKKVKAFEEYMLNACQGAVTNSLEWSFNYFYPDGKGNLALFYKAMEDASFTITGKAQSRLEIRGLMPIHDSEKLPLFISAPVSHIVKLNEPEVHNQTAVSAATHTAIVYARTEAAANELPFARNLLRAIQYRALMIEDKPVSLAAESARQL